MRVYENWLMAKSRLVQKKGMLLSLSMPNVHMAEYPIRPVRNLSL